MDDTSVAPLTAFAAPAAPPRTGERNLTAAYIGFFAMVVGQFMAILDTQVVAASLAQIQAGISASNDEISWVQSAYLIPEVVMIPLSAYLSRLWGVQKLFMASCLGFTIMSVVAGLSTSIESMIIARALQGFLGGAMIPIAYAIPFTAFPPEKQITASTIMGLVVTLAPTFGPTFGGHLTEIASWRWLFFINVVPCVPVMLLVARYGNFDEGDPSLAKGFDWIGLISMTVFLVSLQYVLEEGVKDGWFQDDLIFWLTIVAAVSGIAFLLRQLLYRQPILQFAVFKDGNFTLAVLVNFAHGVAIYGAGFLLPLFLARIQHLSSAQVGTTMLVQGLTLFLVAPIAGRLVRRFDLRICMGFGLAVAAGATWMGSEVNSNWTFWTFAVMQALRSFGILLGIIGAQVMAMATLPTELAKSASGIVNLARNTGGAVGLAILGSQLTANTAAYTDELSAKVSLASTSAQAMLAALTERMTAMGVTDPAGAARKAMQYLISQDAQTLAFGDGFALMALASLGAAAVSLLARPRPKPAPAPTMETP